MQANRESAQVFEDRIGQQRVENFLASRQGDGANNNGPLSPDNLARQRLQLQANPRLAAEAVATYRDIQQEPMIQRSLVA